MELVDGKDGTIENCTNEGEIISETKNAGGIVSGYAGTIKNCKNLNNVTAEGYVGGILSQAAGSIVITNCYNMGNIESSNWIAAGIIGDIYAGATINNCYNMGDIIAKGTWVTYAYAEGIGGTTATNCYNTGKLKSKWGRYTIGAQTVNNCYYFSTLATNGDVVESGVTDVSAKSKEEFVELLNNYKDADNVYPSDWKRWKIGENGYPTIML